jgi:16S rRNA (cytidine1402-2'-O)-methyltransferase
MSSTRFGKLYLIPVPIAADTYNQVLPEYNNYIVQQIDHFLVEHLPTARRYIKRTGHPKELSAIHFIQLDKHTIPYDIAGYMQPLREGKNMGILSEAGCPGVADPGAWAVQYAHKNDIPVIPMVGPSSILLALMASGFNGQNFTFHGYLPIDRQDRKRAIKTLETVAWQTGQTQIFIETPYRNELILEALLESCKDTTKLCIGKNITHPDGWVRTNTIQNWKMNKPMLHKIPTVFLLAGQEQFLNHKLAR